jgi:hypothetical protein
MRRIWISVPLAAMAALWLTSSALAGGFAITTLDPLPHGMQAGQTYQIGYLIRQHGVTPIRDATPSILISRGTERWTFAGRAQGAAGHYVSDVTFPADGDWLWEVDQSPFPMPQTLGSISVAAIPAPVAAEALVPAPVVAEAPVPAPVVAEALVPAPVVAEAPVPSPALAEAPAVVSFAIVQRPRPPAELALLGVVALAFAGVGGALRQVKRVARPAAASAAAEMASGSA